MSAPRPPSRIDGDHVVYLRRVHLDHLAVLAGHLVAVIDEAVANGGLPDALLAQRRDLSDALDRLAEARVRGPGHW